MKAIKMVLFILLISASSADAHSGSAALGMLAVVMSISLIISVTVVISVYNRQDTFFKKVGKVILGLGVFAISYVLLGIILGRFLYSILGG